MIYLPDTNACITFLRQRHSKLVSRWQQTKVCDIALCSIVVYELHYGVERCPYPARELAKVLALRALFASLPFDDVSAEHCARIRMDLERSGTVIGPLDMQIAAVAIQHDLTLTTHNTHEFSRISGLKFEDWES